VLYREHRRAEVLPKYPMHLYEVRPRKDHRGVDLISDALPFSRLWYTEPDAISSGLGRAGIAASQGNAAHLDSSDMGGVYVPLGFRPRRYLPT
jgi:hypothetical protein